MNRRPMSLFTKTHGRLALRSGMAGFALAARTVQRAGADRRCPLIGYRWTRLRHAGWLGAVRLGALSGAVATRSSPRVLGAWAPLAG